MKKLSPAEVAKRKEAQVKATTDKIIKSQEEILKKLDEKPVDKTSSKSDAVAKVAYDKADTALKVANNQDNLITQMTKAIENLQANKEIKGYTMKINRNAEGFMQSIDVEIK